MTIGPESNIPEWRGMEIVGRTINRDYVVADYFGGNWEKLGQTHHRGLRGDEETIRYGRVILQDIFELVTHVPD